MLSRLTTSPAAAFAALVLLPATSLAINLDCARVVTGGQSFDFSELGGPKDVHFVREEPLHVINTTFTIDLCAALKKPKDLSSNETFCSFGTRVCGIERYYTAEGAFQTEMIEVAGEYTISPGKSLDPQITRLKDSASHADAETEGVRLELHGGYWEKNKKDQQAIVELVCAPNLTGNEGFEDTSSASGMKKRADGEHGGSPDDAADDLDTGKALQFVSYKDGDDVGTLRLTWKTKYACEGDVGTAPPSKKAGGWGFFTWFIIVVFLGAAAYIIFGSWLNYNRYGARGWDLIPHGDTIRDLPYIVKDWTSNISDRLRSGGGARGGYSAV